MNAFFASLIVVVVFVPAGLSLKCYYCKSSGSFSSCDDARKEMTCPAGWDACAKAYAAAQLGDTELESYEKTCFKKSLCSSNTCNSGIGKITKCAFNCCDKDLCNGGSRFETSKFLVMMPAVLIGIIKLFG